MDSLQPLPQSHSYITVTICILPCTEVCTPIYICTVLSPLAYKLLRNKESMTLSLFVSHSLAQQVAQRRVQFLELRKTPLEAKGGILLSLQ